VPDDFLTAEIRMPELLEFSGKLGRFDMNEEDLGDKKAMVIHVPGHTPGSIVLYLPDEQMMLTGDDWNPCTWMWFPSSLAAPAWRENMKEAVRLLEEDNGMEIRHVLCSHQPMVRDGKEMKAFLAEGN
jgi:glyoxylase-like metal-dependent hydrolase (beta-lactamase superfamily II)